MNPYEKFKQECATELKAQGADPELARATRQWLDRATPHKYSYHFEWLGRPIIQYPQDVFAMQEIIASVRPELIIETGIAHGGSLIFSASMLELNAVCGGPAAARVLGIDVDIRSHNRAAIEAHPLAKRIDMIQGSSIEPAIVREVHARTSGKRPILVCLDSNHTHEHVLAELEAYAPLVTPGSYCVVFDTIIEELPEDSFPDRTWGRGNNPQTAVSTYLRAHPEFEVDANMDAKLLITVSRGGYLRRTR